MSRKDYKAIAGVLNSGVVGYTTKRKVSKAFAEMLARDNARFDEIKFLEACGLAEN